MNLSFSQSLQYNRSEILPTRGERSIFTVNEFPLFFMAPCLYIYFYCKWIHLKMLMVNDHIAYFLQCLYFYCKCINSLDNANGKWSCCTLFAMCIYVNLSRTAVIILQQKGSLAHCSQKMGKFHIYATWNSVKFMS